MLVAVPPCSWMKNDSAGLAPETDGEDSAYVRMPRQGEHQADGVLVVVTAGEADDVGIRLILYDGVGNKLRALHGVDHQQQVADAFLALGLIPKPIKISDAARRPGT